MIDDPLENLKDTVMKLEIINNKEGKSINLKTIMQKDKQDDFYVIFTYFHNIKFQK